MLPAELIRGAEEYERVFQQYLEICNRAIEQNKNKFPYTEIWGVRRLELEEEMKVEAVIYDDRPKAVYMLRLTKDLKIEIVEKKPLPPEEAWPFTYQYLKRVVDNPQAYIENPAKLEWGWLKPILGSGQSRKKPKSESPEQSSIRLADFIRENTRQIIDEWEIFARTLTPAANDMTPLSLRDHIQELLDFIVDDIESSQTSLEQVQKSKGEKAKNSTPSAAETHAALRLSGGFDIDQMVSEYRALRASVIKLWSAANTELTSQDTIDLTRFNESIDQELAESVSHYTQKVSYSKDLFMGILSHDLRSPLNVISLSTQLMLTTETSKERQIALATQISESATRITHIVNDLLDVTRARFGSGLPVIRAPMDMGFVAKQLIQEMQAANPTRDIILEASGDLNGKWDKARVGQLFSNLIGNAVQYGFKDSAITVAVKGMAEEVLLSVHNLGVPISPEKMGTLFDALTRASTDKGEHSEEVNLGLGLYITEEIVVSHGGTIEVASSEKHGTTFTARFPRAA